VARALAASRDAVERRIRSMSDAVTPAEQAAIRDAAGVK
jgi:hypothetical protein